MLNRNSILYRGYARTMSMMTATSSNPVFSHAGVLVWQKV